MHTTPSSSRSRRLIILLVGLAIFMLGSLANWRAPVLSGAAATTPAPLAYMPLIAKPAPSASATITVTPTTSAAPTATPTATATATEVPPACNAVYPIVLNANLFNDNGFAPPANPAELPYYGIYSDGTYNNKTQRRVYHTTSFAMPSYEILRWKTSQAGSVVELTAALSGTGTLAQGFQEVTPWPDPSTTAPPGYPLLPGQLSPGDWVAGSSGLLNTQAIRAAFDAHIEHKTVMSLPIADQSVGTGQNAAFHFIRLGHFLLRGYNLSSTSYFDLVYLGPAPESAPVC